jgi:hypothetical protein
MEIDSLASSHSIRLYRFSGKLLPLNDPGVRLIPRQLARSWSRSRELLLSSRQYFSWDSHWEFFESALSWPSATLHHFPASGYAAAAQYLSDSCIHLQLQPCSLVLRQLLFFNVNLRYSVLV